MIDWALALLILLVGMPIMVVAIASSAGHTNRNPQPPVNHRRPEPPLAPPKPYRLEKAGRNPPPPEGCVKPAPTPAPPSVRGRNQ